MNLINDPWITAKRADGTICCITPWEIGANENPVVEIQAPRPDFRAALYQFLIGLVQTTFAPKDDDEWEERWKKPPSCKELKNTFSKFIDAFDLINEKGPAFMQDFKIPREAADFKIRALLIDEPGENAIKNNVDHFVKRTSVASLCASCVATALFILQTNAPAGGQGHRTGLRGGGPLTTILFPEESGSIIWETIWLNILALDERFDLIPKNATPDVFPWMGPTQSSIKDKEINPDQVNELQLYWSTPRRIRLNEHTENGKCDTCGSNGRVWQSYRSINYGIKYSAKWLHTLSPYRRQEENDGNISLIAMKGKQGGVAYPDWLFLTLVNDPKNEVTAQVIKSFIEKKIWHLSDKKYRIWCSGYDMDKMKARCWYDQIMPIIILPEEKRFHFINEVQKLVSAADTTARLLRDQVKSAWFDRPKDISGDTAFTAFILSSFWEATETPFFSMADKICSTILADKSITLLLSEWRTVIIKTAERLFDQFALQDTDNLKNMKRIARAAGALSAILWSPKTKTIQALKEVI